MTDLAAANVTVTIGTRDKDFARMGTLKNMSVVSIAFGDGALTYPTGGVPMPAIGNFGLKRTVDLLIPMQPSGNGFVYKYDITNHKMKIFTQGVVTGSALVSPDAADVCTIENSAATAGEPVVMGQGSIAVDTTYDFGPLIELPTTIAPAAVTIKALVVGE